MSQQLLRMAAAALAGSSSAVDVTLNNLTIAYSNVFGDVTCRYTVRRNGDISIRSTSGGTPAAAEWAEPKFASVGDQFQVRFTKTGGNQSLANDGVWQALTSDRAVSVLDVVAGDGTSATLTFTVEIRKGTGSVLDSATISLTSTAESIGGA